MTDSYRGARGQHITSLVHTALALIMLLAGGVAGAGDEAALIRAVQAGDTAAVVRLLDDGADVNARQSDGSSALLWAAHQGDAQTVAALLAAGADVSLRNDYGASPLHEAAIIGEEAVMHLLLEAGADPNVTNLEGETPLMAVARTGRVNGARLLLDAGADIDATERWGGQSALMWAAAQRQPDMVRLLVERGADVDARGTARNWQRRITSEPRPKDMHRGGFTPLLYAAREGCTECARHLVEGGADIDLTNPDRIAPLVMALLNLRFDVAKYLIEAGADVDRWDLYGRGPLYAAVDMHTVPGGARPDLPSTDRTGAVEIVDLLLAAGANPNLQLKLRPPYRNAVFDRGGDNVLSFGATPLLRAAKAADNAMIERLLAYGARVDLANWYGVTPLMAAAGVGHGDRTTRGHLRIRDEMIQAIDRLLEAGADIHATTTEFVQPVNRDPDNVARNQATVFLTNYVPPPGRTALHGAAQMGWDAVVSHLVERGAEVLARDADGMTPQDLAMGRYEPGYLEPPAEPLQETVALLRRLCEHNGAGTCPE